MQMGHRTARLALSNLVLPLLEAARSIVSRGAGDRATHGRVIRRSNGLTIAWDVKARREYE